MTEEELLKLSAYSDDELSEAERLLVESSLEQAPKLRETLDVYGRLHESAILEAVPQPDGATESFWPALQRSLDAPDEAVRRICACAATECAPSVHDERFGAVWKSITIHTVACRETSPRVQTQQWSGVWGRISGRTAVVHSARSARIKSPQINRSAWLWSIGAALAASILLVVFVPKNSVTEAPGETPGTISEAPIAIPDVMDEHYGVRVRLVEGSSDPVVTLYLKNSAYDDATDKGQ